MGDQLLPLYSCQLQPGGGRQAAVNLSSYSHTRRGTHTRTHAHTHAQWGTARSQFLFFRELFEIFFKVFPLLLLFCLVFLLLFFFLCFSVLCFSFCCFSSVFAFGRSAANATERFSVRRVSVGKSKRKAKLKMEIQVRQQQQQQREMCER